jgi:hypothetical protein
MGFIKVTRLFEKKSQSIHVNVDQICSVGAAIDAAPGYLTLITLASGAQAVTEPVETVMQLIKEAKDADDKKGAA